MKKRVVIPLTAEQIYEWKKGTVDYLQSLYPWLPALMREQLMADGVLHPLEMFKGEFLLKPGRPADKAYFLRKGLVKLYYYDEAEGGKLKLIYLWEAGSIVVLFQKFRERLPNANLYMELVEDAELVSITSFSMDNIYEEHTAAYELTNKILCLKTERREMLTSILQMTDKSRRYCRFKELFPGLFLDGVCRLKATEVCALIDVSPGMLRSSKKDCGK